MISSWNKTPLRWASLVAFSAIAIWNAYAGVRHEIAEHYGLSANPEDWARAAQIEPSNAENWDRLGKYRQLDFDHSDLPKAISYYRQAVQINPKSPYYKLDLASALEQSGATAEAEKYFLAAKETFPVSAEVAWRFGNFLLRRQRLTEADAEIHRAVVVDSRLLPLAISRSWHSNPDAQALVNQILPGTPAGDWEALSFLVQSEEGAAALVVWKHLVAQHPVIDTQKEFALINLLLKQGLFDQAGAVWRQAEEIDQAPPSSVADRSLVFDGGFEKDLSGGGLGWNLHSITGVDFNFDTDIKHSGARSARVQFDGKQNLSYDALSQLVLIQPNSRYRFQGFLRTEMVSTDSGVRFEIRDPQRATDLEVLTPNLIRTQPWTFVEAEFKTGPQTHLIQIALRRLPSQRFDNAISGSVWVDDVSILPVDAQE
jgi:tetratricopeptide (TPR) repeat protein